MADLTLAELASNAEIIKDEDINLKCVFASGGVVDFPCDVSSPTAVSVAIGAAGLALLFVVYLTNVVSLSKVALPPKKDTHPRQCRQNFDRVVSTEKLPASWKDLLPRLVMFALYIYPSLSLSHTPLSRRFPFS